MQALDELGLLNRQFSSGVGRHHLPEENIGDLYIVMMASWLIGVLRNKFTLIT